MERLFNFWGRYGPIPQGTKDFIVKNAGIQKYKKGDIFSQPHGNTQYWAFVLEGLVAGIYYPADGKKRIRWFAMPNSYFTTTAHLFTKRIRNVHIEFLENSTLLLIPVTIAKQGQLNHLAISDFFHVLSGKKLEQLRLFLDIIQEEGIDRQYATFRDTMSELEAMTTGEQQCQYFNFGSGSFYRAKKAYLKRPFKKK